MTAITLLYTSLDRCRKRRRFKTLAGAQRFATTWVGPQSAEDCGRYAVSADGIGKLEIVSGTTWADLFPATPAYEGASYPEDHNGES